MDDKYYIAYGSNLNIAEMQMRCPDSKIIGVSEIVNYRLLFMGETNKIYLTIVPYIGESVPVAIWKISRKDEVVLDKYEEYPSLYLKKEFVLSVKKIQNKGIQEYTAFAYIMRDNQALGKPSDCYYKTCVQGYRDFQFDQRKLLTALQDSQIFY